ncbi:MAG: hypothetical protein Q7V63_09390 [Gammaproteobacteria bacterium]|nr:hypothetical protein [Gammaproteobacteria bacterium]
MFYPIKDYPHAFKLTDTPLKVSKKFIEHLKPEQYSEISEDQVVRDGLMLRDMGECGAGLVAVRNFKKGETLLYTGETMRDLKPTDQLYYGLAEKFGKETIAVDAEKSGSMARYMQHLPTEEDLRQYYLFANLVIEKAVAKANCVKQVVKLDGKLFFALTIDQDIEASMDHPVILGFSYGMECYWGGLVVMPRLFDQSANEIDSRAYTYHPETRIILDSKDGKALTANYSHIRGGHYELLLCFNQIAWDSKPHEFMDYRADSEAIVNIKASPLLMMFCSKDLICLIIGKKSVVKFPSSLVASWYIPLHEKEINWGTYADLVAPAIKNLKGYISDRIHQLKDTTDFFNDVSEVMPLAEIIRSATELAYKNLATSLRAVSLELGTSAPILARRLMVLAKLTLGAYYSQVSAVEGKLALTEESGAYNSTSVMAGAGHAKEVDKKVEPAY